MVTTKMFLIGAAVIILGGIGWFAFSDGLMKDETMVEKTDDAMMKKDDGAMVEKGATEGTNDAMVEDKDTMIKEEDGAMMKKGSYESYAPEKLASAQTGDVVLFFRASWCPTCRALDADIRANRDAIPSGLTILDVDYDTSTALKQKYAVTYQHTLVQVDARGNQIAKWSGSPTLADLASRVK